jgi:lysophospholipase L1-like esterase
MLIKLSRPLSCLALSLLLSVSLQAKHFDIRIDNRSHSLVAEAGGCSYQWFKDGAKLEGQTDRFLAVSEGGNYKVEIVGEKGETAATNIPVAVSALGAIIKIYTIGDSTVQDYVAGYYPRKGWGQVLPAFFNTANVQVVNKGAGGTSSMSYYNNQWPAVRDALVAGDFVFIQFGINDRNSADPARYSPTGGVFEGYLTKFVNETKAKGAFPVLVSTIRRNSWNADGVTVYDAYHDHPVAVRTVAKSLGVPLIDLDAKCKVAMEAAGKLYSTRFWYNNYVAGEYPNYVNGNTDDVHLQEMGAINAASLIVQGIKDLTADANVSKLIPFLKPQYQIAVAVNPLGSDDATTRTASYPQGLTVTLKTLPKTGKVFQKWNNAANTQLSTATLTTVTSGTAANSYTAMYQGAVTTVNDCNNTPNGTAKLDNCHRCVAGTTGKTACNAVAEAETEACAYDGVLESSNTGFKGTSYINVPNVIGSAITFHITAANGGSAILSFRYAGTTDRPASVLLNNTALPNPLAFTATGAFTTWKTVDLTLTLLKGANTLKLTSARADGLANIDQIGYVSSGLTKGNCTITGIETPLEVQSWSLFPNPSNTVFYLQSRGTFTYSIFDMAGKALENGNATDQAELGANLPAGAYVLQLQQGQQLKNRMLIKK